MLVAARASNRKVRESLLEARQTDISMVAQTLAEDGQGGSAYKLTSELAQFCLPAASREPERKYVYAISIYFAFLVVGLIGIAKVEKLVVRELPPPPELIPVELPPPDQPVQQEVTEDQVKEFDLSQETPTDAPPMPVVVAPADAQVPFAVPTFGNVAVTGLVARASAPPATAFVRAPPPTAAAPRPPPVAFRRAAGSRPRGSFPEPPFPAGMLRSGQSVDLTLLVELGDDGAPEKVDVETSSGIYELDRKVVQHVKARWKWEPGQSKIWSVPFGFRCN